MSQTYTEVKYCPETENVIYYLRVLFFFSCLSLICLPCFKNTRKVNSKESPFVEVDKERFII